MLRRLVFASAGGVTAAALVALVEGKVVAEAGGARGPSYLAITLADFGLLAPLALSIALAVGVAVAFLEPGRSLSLGEHAARIRAQPVLLRSRNAALAPLLLVAAAAWSVATAHVARAALAQGSPAHAGVTLAAASLVILVALLAIVLAVLRPLRRLLAAGAAHAPRLVDPVTTGGVALVVLATLFAVGIAAGDAGGDGGGALGIFGVLKRSELDLRPVVNLVAIAMAAYLAPIAFAPRSGRFGRVLVALVLPLVALAVTVREARALNDDVPVARAIAGGAPLGKMALGALRTLTDRDHDGVSPYFGGGDCDDTTAARSPMAIEIADNGIDEDCSGEDLHLEGTPSSAPNGAPLPAAKRPALPADLNVILVTIDTLRIDVGFMGYPKPVTPNLDKLAERGVVFDRMYAMASYTGKSIGPLLIGKYPSETKRDGGHFNTYFKDNVLVTERLHDEGFRTFGAASHWYFAPWAGLAQGMDQWDLSAKPGEGQGDNDTSITSAQLSDAAIRLLKKEENTSKRFFMWLHYFDPHEQYMPHEGAPSFGPGAKGAYDGEVWFTDKHLGRVLDYVASQPWGERTAIVVTADHGEAFAEHNMNWHGYELWEPLVRVPFLVYVPGVTPHHVPAKRSHVDLVPTLLDIAGVGAPAAGELSGQSMIDDLVAAPGQPFAERDVFIDMPAGPYTGMRHALIHGSTPGMKLIRSESGQYQLFDLENDPGEKEDLSAEKETLGEMVRLFQTKRASLKEIVVKPDVPAPPQ